MTLTENESSFVVWAALTCMAIIAFFIAIGVKALIGMGKDLHEIKLALIEQKVKHEDLERRVDVIEDEMKYQFRKA